jgi:hypothetical protein
LLVTFIALAATRTQSAWFIEMVFDDLLTKLVERLNGDAFFSDPDKGVRAIAENRMDLLNELDVALAKLGLAVVIAITRVSPDEQGAYGGAIVVGITVQAHEIPPINRAESGTQKTVTQILVKCKSLWDRPWTPDRDVWSPIEFLSFALTDADEQNARVIWTMEFQTRTCLETVVEVLATASDQPLGTENSEPLLVSPTPA